MTLRHQFNGISKLRHYLQVVAFTLVVATLQYAFMPDKPYGPPVVYSVLIGTFTWAIIDLGRELIPSAAETGWPQGWQGIALVIAGIVIGYLAGTLLADALCVYYFRFYPAGTSLSGADQRTSILITAIAGLVGSYYFYAMHKSAYLEDKMAEARMHASEARLKLLETQLEPHMLFNTLANLRVLIGTDPVRAQEMLDRMIAYLRATLTASRSTQHPLANEFDRLRDYLELMAVRMGPRMAYTLDLPDALRDVPVPPLLLQPLVENAIRHGLEPQVEGGHITVRASTRAGPSGPLLVVEVNDTGAGLPDTLPTPGPGQSFGLTQVRERLATLHGAAGTLDLIAASAGGTSASVVFPLKSVTPP
ncbi:histidine kinase [Acidovorax sp. Root275]|uniref:sensor histidine kinase n=1 Tax=Acidovorax sp. Root275 TaxID=1736508 RepID=UPI00070F7E3E|nr:histidine kinase [Acidovorax sp. Root275]KRD50323.1 histidine kinase [Acidovorax sp. Root275]